MKANQPTPQGEHLNKRKILFIGVGLFVALMVIYSFSSSLFEEGGQKNPQRAYQQGQADFLQQKPENSLNASAQNVENAKPDTNFHLPPPDSVFTEPKKSVKAYVKDEFRKDQPKQRRTNYNRPATRRAPTRSQPQQVDPKNKAYRQAQEGSGTIYDANNQNGSNGDRPPQGSGSQQRYNSQPTNHQSQQYQQGRGQIASTQQRPPNPYQQQQPGRGFQNSQHEQISGAMKSPKTPYTLMEGYLIPATLDTKIDSDLPGDIRAFVTRDIYDSIQMKYLLIPKGTQLIGSYDERVVLNQEKLLMSWERMIFPDGRSIRLPKLNTYDLQGQSGLAGEVDNHFWKIFGQSAFLSLIGAATNASLPQQGGFHQQRDAATMAGQQIAQEFNRVSNEVLRRNLNMAPTINIPSATPFNIFLAGDISFQEPYDYKPPEE
jgi:type IV secretory pathway VirB10-like protein